MKAGFRTYTGVEPEQILFERAQSILNFQIVQEALPNLSFPDARFEAAIASHVIEHAASPIEAQLWVREMSRVLTPGGAIVIVAPDVREYRQYFYDQDWSHGWPTTPRRIQQLCESAGLDVAYVGVMHLGRLGVTWRAVSAFLSLLTPTQLGDSLSSKLARRPLISGTKSLLIWGWAYVIATKPNQ